MEIYPFAYPLNFVVSLGVFTGSLPLYSTHLDFVLNLLMRALYDYCQISSCVLYHAYEVPKQRWYIYVYEKFPRNNSERLQ